MDLGTFWEKPSAGLKYWVAVSKKLESPVKGFLSSLDISSFSMLLLYMVSSVSFCNFCRQAGDDDASSKVECN